MNPETNEVTERLKKEYSEIRSYNKLAQKYGVNVRYVWEFLTDGKIPKSKKVRNRLGVTTSSLEHTRTRRHKLNEIARSMGYTSWCAYETAKIKEME